MHTPILLDMASFSSRNDYMLRFFPNIGVDDAEPRKMGVQAPIRRILRRPGVQAWRPVLGPAALCSGAPRADPSSVMADPQRPGPSRPNDPLMQEVRWRLFRHEDLPAR